VRRTKYNKGLSKKDRRGLTIFAITGSIALALVILSFAIRDDGRHNETTLCPTDRPFNRTVVIVDKTDRFTGPQSQFLRVEIIRLRDRMKIFEKLSVYVLSETNYVAAKPVFELCNPGSGEDANALYQNPRKLKRRFDERFGCPLDEVINALLEGERWKTSPVMEMVKNVAFAEQISEKQSGTKLILISDMLENTPAYSHYRDPINFGRFKRSEQYRRVATPLPNVDIQIIYFFRKGQRRLQNARHIVFWERYFQSLGASTSEVRYGP
jgi:hypothetical protein